MINDYEIVTDFIIEELYDKRIERLKKQIESNSKFITIWSKDLKNIIKQKSAILDYINHLVLKDNTTMRTLENIRFEMLGGALLTTNGFINVLSKNHMQATNDFCCKLRISKIKLKERLRE